MEDTAMVERTVFLDRCMVGEIALWFLMTVWENPNFEKDLKRSFKSYKGDLEKAMIAMMPKTFGTLDKLYDLYQKREQAGEFENEEEA